MRKLLFTSAALLLALPAQATILTFDIDGMSNHGSMPGGYGDAVTALDMGSFHYGVGAEGFTPNVNVSYDPAGADPAWWNTGYGDLTNILFEDNDGFGTLEVTLSADSGWFAVLYSWDMAAFSSAFSSDPTIDLVQVRDGSGNVLFDQPNAVISESTHTSYEFSANPFIAETLVLTFHSGNLGGLSDDIAFDNIRFGQSAVPEPASLIALGLGGLALLRRRAKK